MAVAAADVKKLRDATQRLGRRDPLRHGYGDTGGPRLARGIEDARSDTARKRPLAAHDDSSSWWSRRACSLASARRTRDFAVPSEIPVTRATSRYVSPLKYASS